ncbi:MAG: SLAC1 anion channel family protein [Alcaligenaceae bacterium]|nr:SLAC1 anion channel family protein [Alcaligenaceae bacterium]
MTKNNIKLKETMTTGDSSAAALEHSSGWLQHFPIALFASVMGLTGLSIAWLKGAHVLGLPMVVSDVLRYFATAVWFVIVGFYLLKLSRFPAAVHEERAHPVKLNFFAAISVGLILIAIAWTPSAPGLAAWFWFVGAVVHLLFTLMTVNIWIFRPPFKMPQLTAAWFIPAVGNILVPIVGLQYAPADVSWFFFSVGFVFWLVLMTLLCYRLFFYEPLPLKLQPTLFIMIAPPAAGFLAYLSLNNGQLDAFAKILYFSALFLTLLLAMQARHFLRIPFFLTAWGYSFPLAAMTIATLEMATLSAWGFYLIFGSAMLTLVTLLIVILMVKTLLAMVQGKVFIPE